jgi:hypothetical protein
MEGEFTGVEDLDPDGDVPTNADPLAERWPELQAIRCWVPAQIQSIDKFQTSSESPAPYRP